MATRAQRERLIGAAVVRGYEFRQWLLGDPRAAAKSIGVFLTDAEVETIRSLDVEKVEHLLAAMGQTLVGPIVW